MPTPTPTPTQTFFDCCNDKIVTLDNDLDGVSLQFLGDGYNHSMLCFSTKENASHNSQQTDIYYCVDSNDNFVGSIGISSENGIQDYSGISSTDYGVFYLNTPNGECFVIDLKNATKDDYTNRRFRIKKWSKWCCKDTDPSKRWGFLFSRSNLHQHQL